MSSTFNQKLLSPQNQEIDPTKLKLMELSINKEIQMRQFSSDKYNIYQRLKISGKLDMVMEQFISRNSEKIMDLDGHKKLEQLLQKDKEDFEKKQAEESVKKEIKLKETMKTKIPNRDNLRFKAMAQYKAMKDGDVLGFELIDKRLTTKPEIKGMATQSESIEQLEKFKRQQLYESDDNIRVDEDSLENLLT